MTNRKLMMFAVAGLLLPAANAAAQVRAPKTTMIIPHATQDKAPTTGQAPNVRLKKTDQEQPGNEMSTFALFPDGKSGLYFAMTTELPATTAGGPVRRAANKMQCSLTPFSLVQEADGSVNIAVDQTKSKYITNNNGDETRNCNAINAFNTAEGDVCLQYNYQANNTNDTVKYIQCFNQAGDVLLNQTRAFAKNNDDCSMAETIPQFVAKEGNASTYVTWNGCNGNGADDAWVQKFSLTKQADGKYAFARVFDVSVLAREERSRGNCVVGPDSSFALCAGTQGNTQPQRDGAYLMAIDMSPGITGENQQKAILWRKQISGRVQLEGANTYSMRAMVNGIKQLDPATGKVVPTDMVFWRHGALEGNNQNNRKGGEYKQSQFAVIKFSRTGMSYVTEQTGLAYNELLGIDGTHNLNTFALVGQGDQLKPAIFVQSGSHTGGGAASNFRTVVWDQATNKFTNVASFSGAPYDHHYYSNYLGNNPGNQGRNHSFAVFAANPFFGEKGNNDKFLLLNSTTAKGANMDPATKLAAYLSVAPVASGTAPVTPSTPGTGNTGGNNGGNGEGEGEGSDGSDTTLGGCSTGGSAGLATFLLLGLAAFIRRRR